MFISAVFQYYCLFHYRPPAKVIDAASNIVDIFGVPGEDGTGTTHDFGNGRAERKRGMISPKPTWSAADWNVQRGGVSGLTNYDPGRWGSVASHSATTCTTTATAIASLTCSASVTAIHEIQGSGSVSPMEGAGFLEPLGCC